MNILKKAVLFCAFVLFAISVYAQSEPSHPALLEGAKAIESDDQLHEWLTYYYVHPRPDLASSAFLYLAEKGMLMNARRTTPLAAFWAQLCMQNPDMVAGWTKDALKGGDDRQFFFALAAWRANTGQSRAALQTMDANGSKRLKDFIADLYSDPAHDLAIAPIDHPEGIEALWQSFFASGDNKYVEKIISVLPLTNEKDDPEKISIASAARLSLINYAMQHPRVMQICDASFSLFPQDKKLTLIEVIARAKARKPLNIQ